MVDDVFVSIDNFRLPVMTIVRKDGRSVLGSWVSMIKGLGKVLSWNANIVLWMHRLALFIQNHGRRLSL